MARKNKKIFLISIVTSIIVIIFAIVGIMLALNIFKSNEVLFLEYLSGNAASLQMIEDIFNESDYDNLLKTKPYTEDIEIEINDFQNVGTTQENTNNSINQLKLKIEGKEDIQNNYSTKKVELQQQEKAIMTVETIHAGEIDGIKFPDLIEQYISVENGEYEQFLEQIEYEDENIQINDDIVLGVINKNDINLEISNIDKEEKLKKYLQIINEQISKDNITKQTEVVITIDEKELITNCYTLKLTTEQINNMYIKILEAIKQDESILSELESVNIKENFIEQIEKTIEEISKNNIGIEENFISVYESEGQTVRTIIKGIDYEVKLDLLQLANEKYLEFSQKEDEIEIQKVVLNIEQNKINIKYVDNKQEETINISINKKTEINESTRKENVSLKYEKDDRRIECFIDKVNNIQELMEKTEILDEDNYIELDELEEEQANQLLTQIKDEINEEFTDLKEKIKIEEVKDVFVFLGLIEDFQLLDSDGISEVEKNRFNAKFEILKGENLDSAYIIEAIDIIEDNLINLQVVSNKELKIEIDRNDNNLEMVEILKNFIEKQNKIKYNIDVEYDEIDGLVKYVVLTINDLE